jgi:hypothetical protein
MIHDIRFSIKTIINTGAYESLHIELDETVHLEDKHYDIDKCRDILIKKVTKRVEEEVLRARRDIESHRKQ